MTRAPDPEVSVSEWVPPDGCGVLYIASGDPIYCRAALRSAESVRRHSPHLGIHLFSDAAGVEMAERESDRLGITALTIENPHRRSKVDYLKNSPFERTLYLDSDTIACSPLDEVFHVLDRFDVALAHAHQRNQRRTTRRWTVDIPTAFPQFNGGVIAYRRNPAVEEFLNQWSRFYHSEGFRKDQVTLRELLWKSELRIATLPPEFNIRYEKYLRIWDTGEARPRILHLRRFHERPGRLRRLLGPPRPPSLRRWYS